MRWGWVHLQTSELIVNRDGPGRVFAHCVCKRCRCCLEARIMLGGNKPSMWRDFPQADKRAHGTDAQRFLEISLTKHAFLHIHYCSDTSMVALLMCIIQQCYSMPLRMLHTSSIPTCTGFRWQDFTDVSSIVVELAQKYRNGGMGAAMLLLNRSRQTTNFCRW